MTIRVAIQHDTSYQFDRPVRVYPHTLRLRPAPHCRTPICGYTLKVSPEPHFINWQQDPFGNYMARLVFPEPVRTLRFAVEVVADLRVINPFDFFVEEYAEEIPFTYPPALQKELVPYLETEPAGPLLTAHLDRIDRTPRRSVDFLVDLNRQLYERVAYTIRMEPGVQSCERTLALSSGSCRDSAWLLVQVLRHLGLAARFVSGYLVQLTPDVPALDGPSGPKSDFTDLHAWAEVYVPGAGWIGLDPTSGLFAGEGHIPLACTPGVASAAPITGATDECEVEFSFENRVTRIHEDPRVTKPYSDAAWANILGLGDRVDRALQAQDVRLTMGGEPTFVSVDDQESAQWNIAADGPHKRSLAGTLVRRLANRFGAGALLHYGQGKWYPGEPLPRWAYHCYWRRDGQPLWRHSNLLAHPQDPGHLGTDTAETFGKLLAKALGVSATHLTAAYEDIAYYLWREANSPLDIDFSRTNLKDPAERRALARVLNQGLDEPVGYALPLRWAEGRWHTGPWPFRRGHLFLTPGDSPMGLRLPLDSLPWVAEERQRPRHERSLFEPSPPLPDVHGEVAARFSTFAPVDAVGGVQEQPQADIDSLQPVDIPHTAVCLEVREGHLYLFLPPLQYLEHHLDLIAAIERVASELETPVVIEGYPPPQDNRIERLSVTPDPGVIEVNIHPAHSWAQLVEQTEALYEQARLTRLSTEKFMQDGRHTGTGGGNHVTLGGPSPADSPLLRRPDLLQSLITFWQHHPGLSYLFCGAFIGPTSQAPRVDEARHEALYELEIAFAQIPPGEVPQPWLVDRLLRHLLVDITGNTHRAEFCIDKLYSPDSATGRLGLLEFRGFEMPPHARMSLVQMLLLRSLVATFWTQPYRAPLVRWGTELHDRFMLPHCIWRDVADVVNHLRDAGFDFDLDWLAPFLEFRFPHYGSVQIDDIEIELRMAIEPWHVLGEEVTQGGTARFVDSSVERLQVRVTGLTSGRHLLACNGRQVPLRSTGTPGEYVAAVRYRAWQPPSALHPRIGIHAPLSFNLVDTWNMRSLGGCTYHVSHPGGRSYDDFPINAYAAEARRVARYWDFGHTPGPVYPPLPLSGTPRVEATAARPGPAEVPLSEANRDYPYTLDLRRPGSTDTDR